MAANPATQQHHTYVPPATPGWRTCDLCGAGANAGVHRSTTPSTYPVRVTPALLRSWCERDIAATIDYDNQWCIEHGTPEKVQGNPYRFFAAEDYRTGTYQLTVEQIAELVSECTHQLHEDGLGWDQTVGMRRAWSLLLGRCTTALESAGAQ